MNAPLPGHPGGRREFLPELASHTYHPAVDSTHPIRAAAQQLHPRLVNWRRHLHAHPELSGQEEQTARFVANELRAMGLRPVERIGGTFGVTADTGASAEPMTALRADMDALPIQEESELPYRSTRSNTMHACGHDAHMAMLLGAAHILVERAAELAAPVRLIFQPSEEAPPGGAAELIAAGVLENVTRIYGLHIWSEMPLGTLGTRVGPFMSSVSGLHITVHGKGGHAAMPQQCVDPIVVSAEIITALQTVVSRSISLADQAVVSVTRIAAGTADNIIASTAELHGTIRTLDKAVLATVRQRVTALAQGIAAAHGATADVRIGEGYPPLRNDKAAVERVLAAAREIGFADADLLTLPPQGGGEDFACYADRVPGAFVFLGARNEAKGCLYPHHHARFNIDEDALPLGSALLAELGLRGTS